MRFAESPDFPGKVNVGVATFAKRCPLDSFVELLQSDSQEGGVSGRRKRLVLCGHGFGGAVAQMLALRLLTFIDGGAVKATEERRQQHAEAGLGAGAGEANNTAAGGGGERGSGGDGPPPLSLKDKKSLMSRVAVFAFGSPFVGDRVFAAASQKLIDKGQSCFTFFDAYVLLTAPLLSNGVKIDFVYLIAGTA